MTLRIFPDVEQRSEEWFAQRRGIVTASIVGNLITTRKLSAIDYDCPKCGAVAGNQCWNVKRTDTIKTLHTERAAVASRDGRLRHGAHREHAATPGRVTRVRARLD